VHSKEPFEHRLLSVSVVIVKRLVQKKHLRGPDAETAELAAKLLEGVRTEAAGNEAAEMFGTEIDLDRSTRMKGIREVAQGAEVMADGATMPFGPFVDRLRFAMSEAFETVGTVDLAGDAVPGARVVAAATARVLVGNGFDRREAQTFHERT
jgi:hypothetical protein